MDFVGAPVSDKGVVERRFDLKCDDRLVPGVVWTPERAAGPRPLVLIGHGGGDDKRVDYVAGMARRLVRHRGYAAAAIDAARHGERADVAAIDADASGGLPRSLLDLVDVATDTMTADWTATRLALSELGEIGDGPLGYWGVSMGTMFGLPLVAATPEIRATVFGLMGVVRATDPWVVAAPRVSCATLFLAQLDDELVPFDSAIELFRAIGSADKRLHANPGRHAAIPVEEIDACETFFATHLG